MDSNDVRGVWKERTGEYSPAYYAYYGPDATSAAIRQLLDRFVDRDAAVLELGCSSGRHLAHLFADGFDDLTGIDVNADAFDVMAEHYPELADAGTFYCAAIEDVVREFDDDQFDAVYSVETLQHLHHDATWVYDELARITADLLVTVESERALSPSGPTAEPDEAGEPGETVETARGVSYVNDDLPLYHRDWHAIFTDRGFVEVPVDDPAAHSGAPDGERTVGERGVHVEPSDNAGNEAGNEASHEAGNEASDVSALSRDTLRAFRVR